jgi:hypothetical protein
MTGEIRRVDETFTLAGTAYEFMLAQGAQGFSSSSPFAPRVVQGDRKFSDYDPFSSIGFSDLSGGMGQDRAEDVTKYYDAQNVDARGGRLVLGPSIHNTVAVTPWGVNSLSVSPYVINTYLPGYFPVDSVRTKVATTFVLSGSSSSTVYRVYLALRTLTAAGTITVNIYATGGSPAVPTGAALATATLGRFQRNGGRAAGGWVEAVFATPVALTRGTTYWLSVEHSGTADTVGWWGMHGSGTVLFWRDGAWRDNATDTALYPGATQHFGELAFWIDAPPWRDGPLTFLIGAGADLVARLWGWVGRSVYYFGSNGLPTIVENGSSAIHITDADIQHAVWFRHTGTTTHSLYLAVGDSHPMAVFNGSIGSEVWSLLAGTIAGGTLEDIHATCLTIHDGMLWRATNANEVSAMQDGTAWGTECKVGGANYPVRSMLSWNGYLWVGKDDGLYRIDSSTGSPITTLPTVQLVIDFQSMIDSNNFSIMLDHQGDLIFNIANGLFKYTTGGVLTPITPTNGLYLSAAERAYYKAAVSTVSTLWVLAEAPVGIGTGTSLLAYVDGHWHPVTTLARYGDMARSIIMDLGLYDDAPRLWFNAGLETVYVKMPDTTTRRWLCTNMDYLSAGNLTTSWIDGGIRTIDKDWLEVQVHATNVGSGAGEPYIAIYWRPDEDTPWELVPNLLDTTNHRVIAPGLSTCSFPVNSYGGKAQLNIALYRGTLNSVVVTPIIEAIVLKYLERPKDLRAFTRTYELSHMADRSGTARTRTVAAQIADLSTLRNAKEPLTLRTWYGTTYTVHMTDYQAAEQIEWRDDVQDEGRVIVTMKLIEI